MIQVRRNLDDRSAGRNTETTEVDSAGRLANSPSDATLGPVDAAFLGIEDRLRVVMDQRDSLLAENKMLWDANAARERELKCLREQVATLERHLERESQHKSDWRLECLLAEARFRRLIWVSGMVIVILAIVLVGMGWGRI